MAIFPENSDEDVLKILEHIGISKKEREKSFWFVPSTKAAKLPFETPCTPFEAIKKFVDLKGTVAKKTMKNFASYCVSEVDKSKMEAIADSKEMLLSQVNNPKLGLIDVLTSLCPTCKPSLSALLQLSQKIMPRYYTIASSSEMHP